MELIEKLNYIIEELGVKIRFIEIKIGIPQNTLYSYRVGKSSFDNNLKAKRELEKLLENYVIKVNQ